MRCRLAVALVVSGLLVLGACGGESEAEIEARRAQAERDSIAMADSMFNPAVFDTVKWENADARLERGALVWRTSCEKCHGAGGQGGGELAQQFELEVPPLALDTTDVAGIRRAIFVGHEGAMPEWGLHGLKYRDIDAVTAKIIELLKAKSE